MDEPDETVVVRLRAYELYTATPPPRYTYTIVDDDPTVVSLARVGSAAAIGEGQKVEFTVTLGRALVAGEVIDAPLSVGGTGVTTGDWSLAKKSGAANTGVTLHDTGTATPKVRFSGAGAQTATLDLTATADGTADSGESFSIALGADSAFDAAGLGTNVGGGADPHSADNTFSVTVNDLPQPMVFVGTISGPVPESVGTTPLSIGFVRPPGNEALTEDLTVSYTLGGTATAGTDYTIAGADHQAGTGTFTLPSGTPTSFGGTQIPITILDDAVVEGSETIVLTLVDGDDYDLGAGTTSTITITDNEPTLSLAPSTTTTVAEGDAATVGVVLSEARSTATAVRVRMTALSATGGDVDFDSSALTLTVPAGETTATGTVRTTEDTACEGDETFRVAIDASRRPAGVRLASPRSAVITIEDDDTCTVGFERAAWSVTEGGAVSVTVHIDPARSVPTEVGLVYRGASRADPVYRNGYVDPDAYRDWRRGVDTAHRANTSYSNQHRIAFGKDYEASPGRITIPADATSHTFTVRTVDEPPEVTGPAWTYVAVEQDETFTIAIGSFPDRYSRGAHPTTTVTIEDDDADTTVTLARAGAARVDEGDVARFALTATPAPAEPLSVTVEVADSGNFAASGQSGVRQVTVGTDGTGTLTVATVDDSTAEYHGTLTARLRSGAYRRGAEREASVRVSDDDIEVGLWLRSPLPEGVGMVARLTLAKPLDGDQTLTLPLAVGGTATRGTDYRLVCVESNPAGAGTCNDINGASPSVTFHGAHMTSHRVTGPLRLEAIEDGTAESDETVELSLGGGRVLTTTLKDAPTSVTLTFTRGTFSVRENEGDFQPILRVDAAPGRAIEVPLVFTDITATAGTDYETLATTTFPADGATFHSPRIPLIDDTAHEGDETFRVAIDASRLPDWVTVGTHVAAVVTIRDDDTTGPAMWLSPSTVTVDEGLTGTYSVRLATEPTGTVTVAVASDNADVTVSPAQLTFARTGTNLWSTPQAVTVSAAHDTGDGGADDAATLTHTASGGGYAGITGTVAVAVNDDDVTAAPPGVTVSATTLSLAEGGAAGSYTVVLDSAPSANVTVTATSNDADAIKVHASGGTPGASATLTFTPTTWSQTRTLTVTPQDDADADDESVTIAHAVSPTGGYANVTAASVAVAVDDDETTTVPSACDPDDVQSDVEGYVQETQHGTAHVNRWKRVLAAFGVDNGATAMTAAEAQQMADQFSPSRWNPVVTVLTCLEGGTGTGPLVTVTGGNAVTEGGNVRFTVSASPAPAANLAVTLTVDDDATSDFLHTSHEGTQSVTIQANQNSATLTLPTVPDTTDEPDGSVQATVASGSGYRISTPSTATVAVSDDDDPPQAPVVRIAVGGDITEGGTATFTLTATPPPTSALTVGVQVTETGAFAQGGQTGTRNVPIGTGGTGTLTVVTVNDTTDEPNGSLTAAVQAGTGYTPHPSQGAASVAVLDNDVTPVVSIAGGGAITEGGTATFTLSATPPPASALTVGVQVTQSGSFAQSGQTGTKHVTVGTGGTGTLNVATVNDSVDEPDGSLTATVQTGTGYTPSATAHRATVLVADDDVPAGAPTLSVSDATASEGNRDRAMTFTVTLSRASQGYVTFSWRVQESTPVSARRNVDFFGPTHATGHFRPGETEQRFRVYIADDAHDEGPETFEFFVWQVGGAGVADAVGVGTIVNDDPMPAAFLARFGRTAAEQALDGIAGRMAAPRTPGARGTLAGQALGFGEGGSGAVNDGDVIGGTGSLGGTGFGHGSLGVSTGRFGGGYGPEDTHGLGASRTITARELLLGSSFTATGQIDATGGSLAFWGRAAEARFDGREGAFSLDGGTTTAMLGTDYARGDWLLGLALMQSAGEGEYRDAGGGAVRCPEALDAETRRTVCAGAVREGDGTVEASLTAAVPYAAVQASERLKLWGALGIGAGEVTLETAMGQRLDADIDWTMAAAGARSALLPAPAEGSGPALALTTDALWARTSSDATHELAASDSDVTRLRLGLEGSYRMALEGDGSLTPKLEVGARHDGGDAETGFGVELGAGLAWSDPALGLILDLSGRTLIAHGNDDLKDRGFAASLGFDPSPASARGPSLTLRQTLGGQATGGLDALFRAEGLSERTGSDTTTSRWQAEAAYGLPAFGGAFTASPHLGLSLGAGTRDYTLGWRLTPGGTGAGASELSLGVKATRRQSEGAAPEHAVGVELGARW